MQMCENDKLNITKLCYGIIESTFDFWVRAGYVKPVRLNSYKCRSRFLVTVLF